MNYLAHIFLANSNADARLGALLGDFVRSVDADVGDDIRIEIMLHRHIDSFTDTHATTISAKSMFRNETRRFAGILLDIFYDHLLTQKWPQYSSAPLHNFIERFYEGLGEQVHLFPPKFAVVALRMVSENWLGSYTTMEGVELAVTRVSQRLSRNGGQLREGVNDLRRNYEEISSGFDLFFPELIQFAEIQRARLKSTKALS